MAETAKSAVGELVLISGLAVGAWAQYFKSPTGGSIFSKDINLRGTKIKRLVAARRKAPAGLGMNFVVPLDLADGRSTLIEVIEAQLLGNAHGLRLSVREQGCFHIRYMPDDPRIING